MVMLAAARSAEKMLDEIESAKEWIDGFFTDWDERIERYHGRGWRGGSDGDSVEYDPENFAYEWVATQSGKLTLGNPRSRVSTTRSGPERVIAKAHELALNRWARETNMRRLNEKLVVDFGFHRAIVCVLPAHDPEYSDRDDPRGWPSAKRISPKRYVYDVRAIEVEEELWRGYQTIHQKEWLLERAEENTDEHWNVEAIEALVEEGGVEDLRGKGRGREGSSRRNEVVLYNVWVRDYDPTEEDLERYDTWDHPMRVGAWLTLGLYGDGRAEWVRHPFPYWGHRRGPFVLIDGYVIPDEPVGLAQIPAIAEQTRELNVHARALSRAMAKYKKGLLVDSSDPDFETKIAGFQDHFVVGLDGLDDIGKKVMEVAFGGAEDNHIVHLNLCRERVQRNGGITDIERGQVDPHVTATADRLASEASSSRTGFTATKFIDGIREVLENVSVYLAFDETTMRLGPEATRVLVNPETGKPIEEAVWHGGIDSDEELDWYASLGLVIEPYSMGQASEMADQARVMQLLNTLAVLLPMMAQFPFVLWDEVIELVGELLSIENLSDYIDPEALAQYQQLMLQGAEIQAQAGGGKPQARISRDLSRMLAGRPEVGMGGGGGNLMQVLQGSQARSQPQGMMAGAGV